MYTCYRSDLLFKYQPRVYHTSEHLISIFHYLFHLSEKHLQQLLPNIVVEILTYKIHHTQHSIPQLIYYLYITKQILNCVKTTQSYPAHGKVIFRKARFKVTNHFTITCQTNF